MRSLRSPALRSLPYAVTVSSDGRIFVASELPNRVYVFSMQGTLLAILIYQTQGLGIRGLAYYAPLNLPLRR